MRQKVWLVLGVLIALTAAAADDPVRTYADSIVDLVLKKDDAALYEKFLPEFKNKVPYAQFLSAAHALRDSVGEIRTHSYKQHVISNYDTPQGHLQSQGVRYNVTTDRYPDGQLLKIEVVSEGGQLYLARYSFEWDIGKVPTQSQKPSRA